MRLKSPRVFLDTSVIFAAVLSPSGGARKVLLLGESGFLTLLVGPNVLRECEAVIRRKAPATLPMLAQLLAISRVQTSAHPGSEHINQARLLVSYTADAYVLAEAIQSAPNWFVTHDKEHFLNNRAEIQLPFRICTPGELLQAIKDDFLLF